MQRELDYYMKFDQRQNVEDKLDLSSAKLRKLMKLSWKKFDEIIFDPVEAI